MRLYEGNILTCDKENRIAHYLLEDQGKILYCGDELPAGCVAAERVSTGEGALIPPYTVRPAALSPSRIILALFR